MGARALVLSFASLFVAPVLVVSAASAQTAPPPTPLRWKIAPPLSTTWSPTAALVSDPTTQQKVDAVVKHSIELAIRDDGTEEQMAAIDHEWVGDGAKSREWIAFRDLESTISLADAKALLHHESAAIRGFFAGFVAGHSPADAPDLLYSLLGDNTEIFSPEDCTITTFTTVADLALNPILAAPFTINLQREDYFRLIIRDARLSPHIRGSALSYLAQIDKAAALPLAVAAASDANPKWKKEATHIFLTTKWGATVATFPRAASSPH